MSSTTTGFENDVKPYFNACYRQRMLFMLDLWSAGDCQGNWQAIYNSVDNHSMPRPGCPEGVWDDPTRAKFLSTFQNWKDGGFQP